MVPQERATASATDFRIVPLELANAATRYQRLRGVEAEHLALMARHNLLEAWTPAARDTVLAARERVRETREAREEFRAQIRAFVVALRTNREELPAVLRYTGVMLRLLGASGGASRNGDWFEAEVLDWATAEFETL
jgi:hypothetical protein